MNGADDSNCSYIITSAITSILGEDNSSNKKALLVGKLFKIGMNPHSIEKLSRIPELHQLISMPSSFNRKAVANTHSPACRDLLSEAIKQLVADASAPITIVIDESIPKRLQLNCFLIVAVSSLLEKPVLLGLSTPPKYTAEYVRDLTLDVLKSNCISPSQVTAISSDNARYMIKAANLIQQEKGFKHIIHLRCMAHSANLMVEAILDHWKSLKSLLKMVKSFVKECTNDTINEFQNNDIDSSLFNFAPTRWNSAIPALKEFIDKREEILRVTGACRELHAKSLQHCLQDDILMGASKLALRATTKIDSFIKSSQRSTPDLDQVPIDREYIENLFNDLDPEKEDRLSEVIKEHVSDTRGQKELINEYYAALEKARKKYNDNVRETLGVFERISKLSPQKRRNISIRESFEDTFRTADVYGDIEYEWKQYVNPNTRIPGLNKNAIEYWKGLRSQFPKLAAWALGKLSMPLSSACVERSFSIVTREQQDFARASQSKEAFKNEIFASVNEWVIDHVQQSCKVKDDDSIEL